MRMAGPDIVLFVVGALLFGGASFAIVSLDDDLGATTSALGVFDVTWTETAVEVGSEDVAMRSATVEFEVAEERVTSVIVTIACSDPAGATPLGFNLQVTVEGPNGTTADASGSCGPSLEILIPVGAVPPATSVAGSTETEARANLPPPEAAPAIGAWTVTVSGARTGQPPIALPAGDPSGSVTLSVLVAEPTFTPIQR